MKIKKFVIENRPFIAIMLLALQSCGEPPLQNGEAVINDGVPVELYRQIDVEAGVVCYRFKYHQGISCMSISETKLGKN